MKRFVYLSVLCLSFLACKTQKPSQTALSAEDIAANNKGVGLMGQFQYAAARDVFQQLVTKHPENSRLATNLAIATLNRQNQGDEQAALDILAEILKREPQNQAAQYCSGLLHMYLGNEENAFTHFSAVQNDAYARYHTAQILANRGELDQALEKYEATLKENPYLRSAYYGGFRAYQQAGKRERAAALLADFQKLKDNPRAHLFEVKYTRMGPLAEVATVGAATPRKPAEGPLFTANQTLGEENQSWANQPQTGLTAVDLNADGHLDLVQSNALVSGDTYQHVAWLNDGNQQFKPDTTLPFANSADVNSILWGDYDNDGLVDVYVCRNGENQLFRQSAAGTWEDVTASTLTSGGATNTQTGAFFDADHDGDLDLFLVNTKGDNELLNNNRNGTFRPLAQEQGLGGSAADSRQVVVGDLDGDRDADMIVLNTQPPHQVFLNDRLWSYRQDQAYSMFENTAIQAAFIADQNRDGYFEILSVAQDGQVQKWEHKGKEGLVPTTLFNFADTANSSYQLVDLTGNGIGELLAFNAEHISYLQFPDGQAVAETKLEGPGLRNLTPVLLNSEKGYTLAGIAANGQPTLMPPGSGRQNFLVLTLSGKEDTGQAMRSNASGIGTEMALRTGSTWAITHNYPGMTRAGQSAQPFAIGMGPTTTADFLALEWSDGVFQTELGLAAGQLHALSETQRQLSSCPVIFTWNGEEHSFVSDILGVAGIGFAIGKGVYSTPRNWENFLMPKGIAKPKDGSYILKITEPMEEAAYIDSAKLVRYDLPQGWDMVIDERMWISGPEPTGDPIFFRNSVQPKNSFNAKGESLNTALGKTDFIAAPIGKKDSRFLGRLAQDLTITLEFDQPINPAGKNPVLVADGWVEYPYSQTMFAAWQAEASYDAPTLEAKDQQGKWHTVYETFGYPAGMPRRMALPLNDLPANTIALRLSSNLEIYWDHIAVVFQEDCPESRRVELPLKAASLSESGFAKRTNGPQMRPQYDYQQSVPLWDTRHMTGYYTQTGPILPLVTHTDDALAIIGPGEEIHLEFEALDSTSQPNFRLVLESVGWCKDMDLYTKDGDSLGPLPTDGHPPRKRQELHQQFNTRFRAGR